MIIDKIQELREDCLPRYNIKVEGKMHFFDWNQTKEMTSFLKDVVKKITKEINDRTATIKAIKEADKKDPEAVANKKLKTKLSIILSILASVLTLVVSGYLAVEFPYYLWYSIIGGVILSPFVGIITISALEDFIENPEVVELKNERKELVKERNVAKMLIRYINSRGQGVVDKDNIFDFANEKRPSLSRRLRLRMGATPHTCSELSYARKVSANRVKRINRKLERNEKKMSDTKKIPYDIRCAKLSYRSSNIEQLFNARKAIALRNHEAAHTEYESAREAVQTVYKTKRQNFDRRLFHLFDAAVDGERYDLEQLDRIIMEEIGKTGNKKELKFYNEKLKSCLEENKNLDGYQNHADSIRRTIRFQIWYLKKLIKQRDRLLKKRAKNIKEKTLVKTYKI